MPIITALAHLLVKNEKRKKKVRGSDEVAIEWRGGEKIK